jgi:predicted dehydrogenase
MHAHGYAAAVSGLDGVQAAGVWDEDADRAADFARTHGLPVLGGIEDACAAADAVILCGENRRRAVHVEAAAAAGVAILCEKPIATTAEEAERIRRAAGPRFMTAFPCCYSPAWDRLQERLGSIGRLRAINATNRGRCPMGWFVDPALSGGGALIDHTVHVADLLRRLTGSDPLRVWARTGSERLRLPVEDTALLSFDYPDGVFATLDASWSRPDSFRTWGDVTMQIVGDLGLIELDLFSQQVTLTRDGTRLSGYGSDLDRLVVQDLVRMTRDGETPRAGLEDGLAASRVMIAALESAQTGAPVDLP